jgi:hypothetical protein
MGFCAAFDRENLIGVFYVQNQSGGDGETRTPYLSNANAALYQMSYVPK